MFTEVNVTEIFCMADVFCRFFDAMMEKYTLRVPNKRKALAAYCFFPKKPCIVCERAIDNQLALF